MRRPCVFVLLLALLPAVGGANEPERPILALDAGGHTAMVTKVLFTPDGRELITVSDDKTVRVWDVASGDPLRVLRPPIGRGLEGKLYAAALAPDGKTLAVGGYTPDEKMLSRISLIDLAEGRMVRVLTGHTDPILSLAFAPDGRRLASGSGDHTARVWDVATGTCTHVLQGHTGDVYGVAWSPDGRKLVTGSFDTTGRIWSAATGQTEAVLRGHTREVRCVAWRPDGRVVATGGYDRSIKLWGPTGAPFRGFQNLDNLVGSLAFTPDSRGLLTTWGGPNHGHGAALLDLAAGTERVRFPKHTNSVVSGAVSPDGSLAATAGGNDNETFLRKTADGATVHRLASQGRAAFAVAWSADGTTIAWGNTNKGSSLKANHPLERAFRLTELGFAPAPDARYRRARLALGSTALEPAGQGAVAVQRGGATVATLKLTDPYDRVLCATMLPGDRAAVGASFGLYLYDTRTGKQIREFQGHTGEVLAVAPAPDGRHLLSASNDMTLRVWDVDRDEPLLSLFFAGDDWVAWTPEGYYAASPGGEKLVGWHVNKGRDQLADFYPASRFRKTLYRPDVIKLVLSTGSTERALEVADGQNGTKKDVAEVLPPVVEVAAPRQGVRLTAPTVEVKAIAKGRGQPVTALRLLLDGRPYRGQAGVKALDPPRAGEVREAWTVELEPGKHALAVQADSAVSNAVSTPVEVTFERPRDEVALPRLFVLAVGVSDYPGDLRLHYAARDAEAIERMIKQKSQPLYREVRTRLLTDAKATRRAILGGLTWLRQQMTQRDVAVVFFSGHGQKDANGSLFFLPIDVDTDDLLATAVSDDQWKKALGDLPGRVLTLLDACHAGAVGESRRKGPGGLTDDLVRDLVTDDYGVVAMASSTGRESSLESNADRQGVFTLAVVEGLGGKADLNRDGVVYLNELDTYVTDRVKALSKGQQHPVTAKPTSVRSFPLARP